MEFLKYFEIAENSIIMIEFEVGEKRPFFVSRITKGGVTGATMLLGEKLFDLITFPNLYPCEVGNEERYYTGSELYPNGLHRGVLGYRTLTVEEKKEWADKIARKKELRELLKLLQ